MDVYQRYCGHCKTFAEDGIPLTSAVDEDADISPDAIGHSILQEFNCEGCGLRTFAMVEDAADQFCTICFCTSRSRAMSGLSHRQYLAVRRIMGHEERNMGHPKTRRRRP
jgi:hypothetical protein